MPQVQSEKIQTMKQAALDLNLSLKKACKREFLEQTGSTPDFDFFQTFLNELAAEVVPM
jgi:hypothetical protein